MGKENKYSISLFLNKNLKPKIKDNEKTFPVYIQINYKRKNAQIKPTHKIIGTSSSRFYNEKSNIDFFEDVNYISESDFQNMYSYIKENQSNLQSVHTKLNVGTNKNHTLIAIYSIAIIKIDVILKYHIKTYKDFEIRGFGKTLDQYFSSYITLLDDLITSKLYVTAKDILSHIELLQFRQETYSFDKYHLLTYSKKFNPNKHIQIKKEVDALFWIALFAEQNSVEQVYYWSLDTEECIKLFQTYYSKKNFPMSVYYKSRLNFLSEFKDPLSPDLIQFFPNLNKK